MTRLTKSGSNPSTKGATSNAGRIALKFALLAFAFVFAGCQNTQLLSAVQKKIAAATFLSTDKELQTFSIVDPYAIGVISGTEVGVTLPYGTQVTGLTASFTVSPGASVSVNGNSILSGTTRINYSSPVALKVTAADGSQKVYVVTVTLAAYEAKTITSFAFVNPSISGTISETNHSISLTVPHGTTLTALTPQISITGTSVTPASGVAQDFTNPVVYTVKSADGTTQNYTVTVAVAAAANTYQVAFDFQGGSLATGSSTIAVINGAVYGTLPTAVKYGYFFTGWWTQSGGTGALITASATVTILANQTLYAAWTLGSYTVSYDGNQSTGGSVPDSSTVFFNAMATVASNTKALTRTNYAFTGWNTSADGTGTSYSGGQTFQMGGVGVILYAQWSLSHTVTYFANGASGSAPVDSGSYLYGASVTVADHGSLSRTGYQFMGWSANSMATEATYSAGSIFAMGSADVLLYAVWSQLYTLSYNANGATFGSAPGSVTAIAGAQTIDAGAAKLFKVTSTVSYRISSWNTQSGGGGTLYHSGATLGLTQNTILYAQWTALAVGDIGPSGGKIFLDAGNYTAGYRYMEVAPSDSATNFVWASRSGVTNATGTAVGTGKNNTQVIYNVASWNSGNWAVLQVIGLYFGLSDWFLPSTGELTALFNNLNNLGGPTELQQIGMYGWEYWSSTEVDMLNADYVYFGGSAQTLPMGKGYTCNVRAIREF